MKTHAIQNMCALLVLFLAVSSPAARAQPWQGDNAYCYVMADGDDEQGEDQLFSLQKDGSNHLPIGSGTGLLDIEAIAFDPRALLNPDGTPSSCGVLYAADANTFGWLALDAACYGANPPAAGTFIPIGDGFGECTLPGNQAYTPTDVDGLQFDLSTGILWGTERNNGVDYILQIDPQSGTVRPNAFPDLGAEVSCMPSANVAPRLDIDDIAIDPNSGDIYVVNSGGGLVDLLLQIDPADGSLVRVVGPFDPGGIVDMEGLTFDVSGTRLFGTTGKDGNPANGLWSIDHHDNNTTQLLAPLSISSDHEGIACLTDNVITGTVYEDLNENGSYEPASGETGRPGVTVGLYSDNNGDLVRDAGDTLLASTTSDESGTYFFNVATAAPFIVYVNGDVLANDGRLTTENFQSADFRATASVPLFGNREDDNHFGTAGFDTDDDGIPDTSDPDDDNDGIADVLDAQRVNPNNACASQGPNDVTLQANVTTDLSCAARVAISVVAPTDVTVPGFLHLISPTVVFQSGFSVGGGGRLQVISADPCPGCTP